MRNTANRYNRKENVYELSKGDYNTKKNPIMNILWRLPKKFEAHGI